MKLTELIQNIEIGDIGNNSAITIIMDQKGAVVKNTDSDYLLNRLAKKHLEDGGDYKSWINICKFVLILEAEKFFNTANEAADNLGIVRPYLSMLKHKPEFIEFKKSQ